MEKVRVRRQVSERIYAHNDLSNGAHYFKEVAEEKLAVGDREGIAFDILASLVLLAFAFEAKVNFLGYKLITGWRERQPFNNKVDEVLAATGVVPDWYQRPYRTVSRIKALRDGIAHSKPMVIEANEVESAGEGGGLDLCGEWETYCNEVFLCMFREI